MKKSYHSSDVPIRLATMTLRTDDGAGVGTRLTVDIWCLLDSVPEAALPLPVRAERADEVHLPEVGPQRFAEIELAMRGLPHQEPGQPLLARRPDDQVGVRLALGVEVLGDVLDVKALGEFINGGAVLGMPGKQRANRVAQLVPAAVRDGNVDQHPVDVRGIPISHLEPLGRLSG